jgi:hypothetical protein
MYTRFLNIKTRHPLTREGQLISMFIAKVSSQSRRPILRQIHGLPRSNGRSERVRNDALVLPAEVELNKPDSGDAITKAVARDLERNALKLDPGHDAG